MSNPTRNRLNEIKARADAATEGPWTWGGNVDTQSIRLQTWNHLHDGQRVGVVQIMDFVRQGMQGAQPRFMSPDAVYRKVVAHISLGDDEAAEGLCYECDMDPMQYRLARREGLENRKEIFG